MSHIMKYPVFIIACLTIQIQAAIKASHFQHNELPSNDANNITMVTASRLLRTRSRIQCAKKCADIGTSCHSFQFQTADKLCFIVDDDLPMIYHVVHQGCYNNLDYIEATTVAMVTRMEPEPTSDQATTLRDLELTTEEALAFTTPLVPTPTPPVPVPVPVPAPTPYPSLPYPAPAPAPSPPIYYPGSYEEKR